MACESGPVVPASFSLPFLAHQNHPQVKVIITGRMDGWSLHEGDRYTSNLRKLSQIDITQPNFEHFLSESSSCVLSYFQITCVYYMYTHMYIYICLCVYTYITYVYSIYIYMDVYSEYMFLNSLLRMYSTVYVPPISAPCCNFQGTRSNFTKVSLCFSLIKLKALRICARTKRFMASIEVFMSISKHSAI